MRGERGLLGKGGVKGLCMQVRDKMIGRVMYFFHAVFPDEPEERAEGPFPLRSGTAEGTPEGGIVHRQVVKGSEGKQREPDRGGPKPRLS